MLFKKNTKFQNLAPVIRGRKGQVKDVLSSISKEGFIRVRIDGKEVNLSDEIKLTKNKKHFIEVIVDRLIIKENISI